MRNFCFIVLFLFSVVFSQRVTTTVSFSISCSDEQPAGWCGSVGGNWFGLSGSCGGNVSSDDVNLNSSGAYDGCVIMPPSEGTYTYTLGGVSREVSWGCNGWGCNFGSGWFSAPSGVSHCGVSSSVVVSGTITLSCPDDICERVPDLCPSSSSASESSSSSEFDSSSSSEEWDSSSSSEDWVSSSSSEEGASSSSSEDWVSSSSSEEGDSSSSSEDWVSSSSHAEDGDCYGSELEASYAFSTKLIQCQANGGDISEMKLAGRCITGSCRSPFSSSSLGGAGSSSSFGGGGGEDVCVAARRLLQKTADASDDWVYIGKEVYGSQKARRPAPKFTGKFFDVLGRVYDRITVRKAYYTREPLPVGQEYEFAKEFEVWARIIKDSDGRDIHVFRKEDELRKFRRDSSFYWDGYWEVMEKDELARTIRSRTSLGMKTAIEYDIVWRINKYYLMDNNNDTITAEQYFWQNGRLVKMIQNGLERIYIYGKTLQDTVKVIPSDEGLYFHQGYNNSIGMIPNENDAMYEYFVKDPYGGMYSSNDKNSKSFLSKLNAYQYPIVELDIPIPKFVNPSRNTCKSIICPTDHTTNGYVVFGNLLLSEDNTTIWPSCVMDINFCNYRISYGIYVDILLFEILQSTLVLNPREGKWNRYCRTGEELQDVYNHERKHILNAKEYANKIVNEHMPKTFFDSKNRCELFKREAENIIYEKFALWKRKEADHANLNSPQRTGTKKGELCDVE